MLSINEFHGRQCGKTMIVAGAIREHIRRFGPNLCAMVYPTFNMARDAQRRLAIQENIFFWAPMPYDSLDLLRYRSLVVFEDVSVWPLARYTELLGILKNEARVYPNEPRNLLITF